MNLKELADALGLSPTTVSRALNGYPEVSGATRDRVAEAAKIHNYRPNVRAKGLATGRTMAIGHIIPRSARQEVVNPVFADFIAGAGEIYALAGYDMMLSVVNDEDEPRVYQDLLSRGTVDGVIVHAPRSNDPRIELLHRIGMPFVVHGRSSGARNPYSWLDVNNRRAFHRATAMLMDLGHQRIALINGLDHMDFAIRRAKGYEEALTARGVPPDNALRQSDEMTEAYGFRAATEMLKLADPPTAFVVSSMVSAIGVRRAAEARGMRLGRDLSVVTHDDDLSYLRNGDESPIFSATKSSVREAGQLTAEMLLKLIATPGSAPLTRLLEAELVVGGSTGPGPAAQLTAPKVRRARK